MTPVRGCGSRVKAAVYCDIPLSRHGLPLESFLFCPPIVVDAQDLGITNIGVKLIEKNGVWHILDIVGKQHYPNVLDFVEEARRFGISRRLATTLEFSKLTQESRLILLHERAHIDNFKEYTLEEQCPKLVESHTQPLKEMCISLWGEDLINGEVLDGRRVKRVMPSFTYEGKSKPENVVPNYRLAIFGSFPIPRLVVIKSEDNSHEKSMLKAGKANLPVKLVDD